MTALPVTALVLTAAGLLLCRPWLEADRSVGSIPLGLGIAIGLFAGRAPGGEEIAALLDPLFALSAGWLVLAAAESWDLTGLRSGRPGRLALAACVPAIAAPLAALAVGRVVAAAPFMLLTCAALALDPQAAREMLGASRRPGSGLRSAPARAALLLGTAMLASSAAAGLAHAGADLSVHPAGILALHVTGSLALGLALGVGACAATRLAGNRALITSLLIVVALGGWGISRGLGLSPPAVLFAAGIVLASDGSKRDLVFTSLREMDRPFTLALMVIAGMRLSGTMTGRGIGAFWLPAVVYALVLLAGWRLVPVSGSGGLRRLPLSPLVLPLAFLGIAPAWLGAAVLAAFVLGEAAAWTAARSHGADT